MKIFVALIILTMSLAAQARSVIPLMFANVKYSKLEDDNKLLLSPAKVSDGFYENVELLEIDNTLVLR